MRKLCEVSTAGEEVMPPERDSWRVGRLGFAVMNAPRETRGGGGREAKRETLAEGVAVTKPAEGGVVFGRGEWGDDSRASVRGSGRDAAGEGGGGRALGICGRERCVDGGGGRFAGRRRGAEACGEGGERLDGDGENLAEDSGGVDGGELSTPRSKALTLPRDS